MALIRQRAKILASASLADSSGPSISILSLHILRRSLNLCLFCLPGGSKPTKTKTKKRYWVIQSNSHKVKIGRFWFQGRHSRYMVSNNPKLPVSGCSVLLIGFLCIAGNAHSEPVPVSSGYLLHELALDSPLIEAYDYLKIPSKESAPTAFTNELMKLLHKAEDYTRRRLLASLKVQLDYKFSYFATDDDANVDLFYEKLHAIERGEDPFEHDITSLRGYYAENDNSCQPFKVSTPFDYRRNSQKKYPLVLTLHHHGWSDWYRPFQGYASFLTDAIVIAPHGRGSCDYLWIAEQDTLECIKAAKDEFNIDPDRIYVTGWSMGGTGSFHLPGRYPDIFAASFPKAGNADFTAWEEAWKEDRQRSDSPRLPERMFLRWETAPVTFAENFLHTPIAIEHGAMDDINPVNHSKSMAGRLKELGYNKVTFKAGEGGHSWGSMFSERWDWMKPYRRTTHPKRVRLKISKLRHGKAWWLTITRLSQRMKLAEIDVQVVNNKRIEIKRSDNISGFTLDLIPELDLDPEKVELAFTHGKKPVEVALPSPTPAKISVLLKNGQWKATTPEDSSTNPQPAAWPPAKRAGLEGPIEDAVMDAFLVVIGSTGDAWDKKIVKGEAERWMRQWRRRYQTVPRAKFDVNVTGEDIDAFNLVLFGGPAHNLIVRRINDRLPVRFGDDTVLVGNTEYTGQGLGLKSIYPNPENPNRTVVVFGAVDWKGMWQISHRFGTWFDWMPLDNRQWFDYCVFDDQTQGFETFQDVGFFDEDWRLENGVSYKAIPDWRAKTSAREYPKFREIPAEGNVRLSELWPGQMDTARDPFRINRSFKGLPLSIGHQRQPWGLGQWIESAVTYDLEGKFRRFEVKAGIDAEGQQKISEARKEVEFTKFVIQGDGRELDVLNSVQFGDKPYLMDVDVTGVKKLTLMVLRTYPQGWLYGNISWGEPLLRR